MECNPKHYNGSRATQRRALRELWSIVFFSDPKIVTCGIPQGSILGPLLFLLYINDFPNSNLVSTVRMYADDTSLTYASSSPDELQHAINHDLKNVLVWLNSNSLSLNITKTKWMYLGIRHKLGLLPEDDLNINMIAGCQIQSV